MKETEGDFNSPEKQFSRFIITMVVSIPISIFPLITYLLTAIEDIVPYDFESGVVIFIWILTLLPLYKIVEWIEVKLTKANTEVRKR